MKEKIFLKKVLDENMPDKEQIRQRAINSGNKATQRRINLKKSFVPIAAAAVVVLAVVIGILSANYVPLSGDPQDSGSKRAGNYQKIYEVIESYYKMGNQSIINSDPNGSFLGTEAISPTPPTAADQDASEGGVKNEDYSKTNVQTDGMDEGDIVKTDGQYIYKLSTQGCYIISVANGNMILFPSLNIPNYVPREMYVTGNKLVIIGGIYQYNPYSNGVDFSADIAPSVDLIYYYYSYCSQTDIRVYDITYKNEPTLERHLVVDGNFYTSRIMESENKLFYMINYNFYYGNEDSYIPKISDSAKNNGQAELIPAEDIYYYSNISAYSYLILGQIDLDTPSDNAITKAYLGLNGTIYVSDAHIFVATYDYYNAYKINAKGQITVNFKTRIAKLALSDLSDKAEGWVDGTIKDRLSMDEYNGFLRVATTVPSWWNTGDSYNNLFVLAPDLTIAGKITNIAPGETIYSARFNKEKGSIVTFQMVDPYFSFDLSDPYNPKITNEVKEDGVSHYIHYIGDTGYTIGVGQMSEVTTYGNSSFVRWTGLKVSLYDNVSPDAVATIVLSGSVHSSLFYDPKALLYDEDRGLFAFPYENWTYTTIESQYYSSMEQGLAVFKIDLSQDEDEDKLVYRDTLTNFDGVDLTNFNYYYNSYMSFIVRGIRIGDYIYTISDREIKSYSLDTLTEVSSLELYYVLNS